MREIPNEALAKSLAESMHPSGGKILPMMQNRLIGSLDSWLTQQYFASYPEKDLGGNLAVLGFINQRGSDLSSVSEFFKIQQDALGTTHIQLELLLVKMVNL